MPSDVCFGVWCRLACQGRPFSGVAMLQTQRGEGNVQHFFVTVNRKNSGPESRHLKSEFVSRKIASRETFIDNFQLVTELGHVRVRVFPMSEFEP